MNQYEVKINLSIDDLSNRLNAINKQISELGKHNSLSALQGGVKNIASELSTIPAAIAKESEKASARMTAQFKKARILQDMGASLGTVNARASMADPFIAQLNTAKKLVAVVDQLDHKLMVARNDANALNTVMSHASQATGKALGMDRPGMFSQMSRGIQTFTSHLKGNEAAVMKNAAIIKAHETILSSWWNNFGRIGLGFTIVYRAMNALGAVLTKTMETIKQSITDTSEFAALQAKLAMFTVMASKGAIGFDQAFSQSGMTVSALGKASITAISSIGDLSIALDEVAQAGVLLPPKMMSAFTSFVDFTTLISSNGQDTSRQLRSEINALAQGQMRTNNVLIQAMKNFGIITDEEIKKLKNMTDRSKIFTKVIEAVAKNWNDAKAKLMETDITKALPMWEKSIRYLLMTSLQMVSQSKGVLNIFGAVLKKHTDEWSKNFENMSKNINVKSFAVMFVQLASVFDKVLYAFEGMIIWIGKLSVALTNLSTPLKTVLKLFLAWEVAVNILKLLSTITLAMKAWNVQILTLITSLLQANATVLLWAGGIAITVTALFIAGTAIGTLTDRVLNSDGIIKGFIETLKSLRKHSAELGLAMIALGLATGTVPLALLGGTIALTGFADKTTDALKEATEKFRNMTEQDLIMKRANLVYNMQKTKLLISKYGPNATVESLNAEAKVAATKLDIQAIDTLLDKMYNPMSLTEMRQKPKPIPTTFAEQFKADLTTNLGELGKVSSAIMDPIWAKIFTPHITLNEDLLNVPFQGITEKAKVNLKELEKEVGNLGSNMYESFIKAVNEGNVKVADRLFNPAKYELETKKLELGKRAKDIEAVLNALAVPGPARDQSVKWHSYNNELLETTIKLEEIADKQENLGHMFQLTPGINSAQLLNDELKYLNETLEAGTQAYIDQANVIKDRYKLSMRGVIVNPEDKKAMDKFNSWTGDMKTLTDATRDWKDGIEAGFQELAKPQMFEQFRDIVVSGFRSMEDALVNFATKGKAAFKDLANSILNDMLRIMVRAQITGPLAMLFSQTFFPSTPDATTALNEYSSSTQRGLEAHAQGGWINEKIIGVGLSTGKMHSFAENGPEYVSPEGETGGTVINIINNTPAQVQAAETKSGGGKRIDIMIDEIMAGKLSGGSKSSMVLKKMYGLQTALAGR